MILCFYMLLPALEELCAGKFCYSSPLLSEQVSFAQAVTACESNGAYVTTITSKEENDLVHMGLKQHFFFGQNTRIWLGYTDQDAEGTWVAVNDQHILCVGNKPCLGDEYLQWDGGEPNNYNNEDCAEMWGNGYWNDIPCSNLRYTICKREYEVVEPPPPYYPRGVQLDVPKANVDLNAWKLCYEAPYGAILGSDMAAVIDNCNGEYTLVAAHERASDTFLLLAAGETSEVTKPTFSPIEAYPHNGAYWYRYPGKSFGFSDSSDILLLPADMMNYGWQCSYRLSWHLLSSEGGWRAGCLIWLNYDTTVYKAVYTSNLDADTYTAYEIGEWPNQCPPQEAPNNQFDGAIGEINIATYDDYRLRVAIPLSMNAIDDSSGQLDAGFQIAFGKTVEDVAFGTLQTLGGCPICQIKGDESMDNCQPDDKYIVHTELLDTSSDCDNGARLLIMDLDLRYNAEEDEDVCSFDLYRGETYLKYEHQLFVQATMAEISQLDGDLKGYQDEKAPEGSTVYRTDLISKSIKVEYPNTVHVEALGQSLVLENAAMEELFPSATYQWVDVDDDLPLHKLEVLTRTQIPYEIKAASIVVDGDEQNSAYPMTVVGDCDTSDDEGVCQQNLVVSSEDTDFHFPDCSEHEYQLFDVVLGCQNDYTGACTERLVEFGPTFYLNIDFCPDLSLVSDDGWAEMSVYRSEELAENGEDQTFLFANNELIFVRIDVHHLHGAYLEVHSCSLQDDGGAYDPILVSTETETIVPPGQPAPIYQDCAPEPCTDRPEIQVIQTMGLYDEYGSGGDFIVLSIIADKMLFPGLDDDIDGGSFTLECTLHNYGFDFISRRARNLRDEVPSKIVARVLVQNKDDLTADTQIFVKPQQKQSSTQPEAADGFSGSKSDFKQSSVFFVAAAAVFILVAIGVITGIWLSMKRLKQSKAVLHEAQNTYAVERGGSIVEGTFLPQRRPDSVAL